jgi:hypothetical protein
MPSSPAAGIAGDRLDAVMLSSGCYNPFCRICKENRMAAASLRTESKADHALYKAERKELP